MVDYIRLQATAARLIRANGVPVTLVKQGRAIDYDPASGTADAMRPTKFPGYAVRESKGGAEYQVIDAQGATGSKRSMGVMLSIQGTEISIGDRIQMNGSQWRIYGFTPLSPGAVILYYRAALALI